MSDISTPAINVRSSFAIDIEKGLSSYPKKLPSKYFYNEAGNLLFQEIMAMPTYYLTDAEFNIFQTQASEILQAIENQPFELIELGAGDGSRTNLLLKHFSDKKVDFIYRPIGISPHVLTQLEENCCAEIPNLNVKSVAGDYFEALAKIKKEGSTRRKVVLFLGSNIGNFPQAEAENFLQKLASNMNAGDKLLIGFDLKKNPKTILEAYNDPAGITAAFNLNLLTRINRELKGEFDLSKFRHWETYDPATGEAKSYIVSKEAQSVPIRQLQLIVHFEPWEAIAVEVSCKYNRKDIAAFAHKAGFEINQHFTDTNNYFVDSLWELKD